MRVSFKKEAESPISADLHSVNKTNMFLSPKSSIYTNKNIVAFAAKTSSVSIT